jgi:hypothetical protein
LRCSAQASRIRTSTSGDGTSSSARGSLGSTPLAALTGSASGTLGLFGRNPNSSTLAWFSGRCTYSSNALAATFCSGVTHSVSRMMNGLSENRVPSLG